MSAMGPMDRERFDELKDAYVLDALTEDERREFEEHLAAHPERQTFRNASCARSSAACFSPIIL